MKVHIAFPGTLGVLLRLAQELEDSLLPVGGGNGEVLGAPSELPSAQEGPGDPRHRCGKP